MTGTSAAMAEIAEYADEYQTRVFDDVLKEFDRTRSGLLHADSTTSLKFFFRLYGFNREGAPRETYAESANNALETATTRQEIDADELWQGFKARCRDADVGINPRCTRGVVKDTAKLVNRKGNLFKWVGLEINDHGRLTEPYNKLTSFNGIGPKIAPFFLRDAVWVCGVEDEIRGSDRYLLQSMTSWVELVAEGLWPGLAGTDDESLAKHIVDACDDYGVSSVAFNQGAWYFARNVVGDSNVVPERVRELQ